MADGSELPVEIVNGRPGYINFLDALNSWQLVKEIKAATGMAAATSFKHVSPTSAAVGKALSPALKKSCFVDDIEGLDDSPLACAYARARGTDRMSSFGDWIAAGDRAYRKDMPHVLLSHLFVAGGRTSESERRPRLLCNAQQRKKHAEHHRKRISRF